MSPGAVYAPDKLSAFRASLSGGSLCPGDAGYEEARQVHNAMIDRRPAVIARCSGVSDVMRTVEFARSNQLPLSIRAGGHHVAGFGVCDGGVTLDLRAMRGIRVEPKARRVRALAGATWGELDRETELFGLATTGGVVSTTGIAGLTLGGGLGYLMRKHGLACDNLLSADVVTADGRLVHAGPNEATDLFWGLRGGGGNFGVVTSFEYQLHPVREVFGGMLLYPANQAAGFLRLFRDVGLEAPDELGAIAAIVTLPDGARAVGAIVVFSGQMEEGGKLLRPLRQFGPALLDEIGPVPYSAVQSIVGAMNPPGARNYWKSNFLRELSDAAIETIVDRAETVPSPRTHIVLELMGGKMAGVGRAESAFDQRDSPFNFGVFSMWTDSGEDERNIAWTRAFCDAMQPYTSGGIYVNYLGDASEEGSARAAAAYCRPKRQRLLVLKRKYDPENLFRFNQNIAPEEISEAYPPQGVSAPRASGVRKAS